MKKYTQEMRINKEPCPYCGFWHSAVSHPPQFSGYVLEIQALEGRLKEYELALELIGIKRNPDFEIEGDVVSPWTYETDGGPMPAYTVFEALEKTLALI